MNGSPDTPSFPDRATGCILGLAIGDAIGAPLRGMKSGRVAQVFGRIEEYPDPQLAWADRPSRWTLKGLHTSHTQLALAAGDAPLLGDDALAEFRELATTLASRGEEPGGVLRDASNDLRVAFRTLRDSPFNPAPFSPDPGPMLWAAPWGIRHARFGSLDLAVHAPLLAGLGSSDRRVRICAAAFARLLSDALNGLWDSRPVTGAGFESLMEFSREMESRLYAEPEDEMGREWRDMRHALSQTLEAIPAVLGENNEDLARRSIVAEASRHNPPEHWDDPQAPFAPANFAWALYLALRHTRFDRAMLVALAGGRETPAVGAFIGAFLGARHGASAIPASYKSGLLGRAFLEERARAWADDDVATVVSEGLVEFESDWTRRESEARRQVSASLEAGQKRRDDRKKPPAKQPSAPQPAPPLTTYARSAPPTLDTLDPEEARRLKVQRGRKRIEWKEERQRKDRRRE